MTHSPPAPRRVIIDTDPGQDDAFALLLALGSPELEVLGVTTVSGNLAVETTTRAALQVLDLAGRADIPLHAGATRPLIRPVQYAPDVHGDSGIDGWDWPEPSRAAGPGHAVDWIVATLSAAAPASVTVVLLGPQTNLALALRRDPAIVRALERIVFMGGGYFAGGNRTPAAEFNILVDPESAAIVLGCGVPCTATPLDCTNTAPAPAGWPDALERIGGPVGAACAGMLRFFEAFGIAKRGVPLPLHDALAVGWLLWPEIYTGRLCPVAVELAGQLTTGATVVDYWRRTGARDNCLWLTACDAAAFYPRLLGRLAAVQSRVAAIGAAGTPAPP